MRVCVMCCGACKAKAASLVDGLFKRRALEDDFDGEWAVALIVAVTEAALSGRLALNATSLREPMMALRNAAPAH